MTEKGEAEPKEDDNKIPKTQRKFDSIKKEKRREKRERKGKNNLTVIKRNRIYQERKKENDGKREKEDIQKEEGREKVTDLQKKDRKRTTERTGRHRKQ